MTETASRPPLLHGAPKVLFWVGLVLFVLGIGVGVVGVVATVRAAPLDVVTMSGEPGSAVVGVVDAPGAGDVALETDVEYSFLLVGPKDATSLRLDEAIIVTGPDGTAVDVVPGSSAGFTISGGDRSGRVVSAVVPESGGAYTVTVPEADVASAQVFVAKIPPTSTFVLGLFGGVAGIIIGSLLGTAGFFVFVGALIWGAIRRGAHPRG